MENMNKLADYVQGATAETLQSLHCPSCSGAINVQFVPRGRRGKGAGSLSLMCAKCMWRVISDGISTAPPWVQVLGLKYRTADKPVSPPSPQQSKKTKSTLTA
jgi:hypothetical protein